MLSLKSATHPRWFGQVERNLDEVLIDHAHCEKKAAGAAMNLIVAYVDQDELCRCMEGIVVEELEHFRMVLELLKRRGIRFTRQQPSSYGKRLHQQVRRQEPGRAVDRLLVAGLIEARSCERFSILRDHVPDAELAEFYGSLFESEARHHATYVRLARIFADPAEVAARWNALAEREADIIGAGDPLARMHS